jgi:tetratricopeptide (TPR) repeat protein
VVKPAKVGIVPFDILKARLLRGTPTSETRRLVYGESREALDVMNQVKAAIELDDKERIVNVATELLKADPTMPTVERALGLHLSREMMYEQAVALLERSLRFEMSDGTYPFARDVQAVQQLAVSLSALGRNTDAVTWLESLPVEAKNHSETMGIRAGRIKRQWQKKPGNLGIGRRALDMYQAAYESAESAENVDQVLYNGINVAYMRFALDMPHQDMAGAVLKAAIEREDPDYWTLATRAEAHLLLHEFSAAAQWYETAFTEAPFPRYLATTAEQALNILKQLGDAQETKSLRTVIRDAFPLLLEGVPAEEIVPEDAD